MLLPTSLAPFAPNTCDNMTASPLPAPGVCVKCFAIPYGTVGYLTSQLLEASKPTVKTCLDDHSLMLYPEDGETQV